MDEQINLKIKTLQALINGNVGLRKIHKEETFPLIIEYLKDYKRIKNNIEPKNVDYETWNNISGWSCPNCGQWCYKDHNYHYCGRCGQKFLHQI